MEKAVDISIVIVNFNSGDFLARCVQSIEHSDRKGLAIELIVVDNNSTDQSITNIKNNPIVTKIIYNKENLGFSKANNIGVKYAHGKYLLFLNPDIVVEQKALKKVFQFMQAHSKVGASSPLLRLADGRLDEASHRGFPTPWNAFTYFLRLSKLFPKSKLFAGYTKDWLLQEASPHEVDSISGAFFFTRKEAGADVGWWDEDYFWYGEDIDFCYRLKKRGWLIYSLPGIKVIHFRGVTSGIKKHSRKYSSADFQTRLKAVRASTEAMRIFYKKHYQQKYPFLINQTVFLAIGLLTKIRLLKVRWF